MPRKTLRPRAYAIAHGHVMYEGKPCPRCFGRRRYVSCRACVHCTNERDRDAGPTLSRLGHDPDSAIARLFARAAGETFYQGHACDACGHDWRYVSNTECIACHERRHKARQRDHAAEWRARKPATAPMAPPPSSSPLWRLYTCILGSDASATESP